MRKGIENIVTAYELVGDGFGRTVPASEPLE